MKPMLLSLAFQTYLTYAPLIIFGVWIYLAVKQYKSFTTFAKAAGGRKAIWRSAFSEPHQSDDYRAAREVYRKQMRKYLLIWVISVVLFTIITFVMGIATASQ